MKDSNKVIRVIGETSFQSNMNYRINVLITYYQLTQIIEHLLGVGRIS